MEVDWRGCWTKLGCLRDGGITGERRFLDKRCLLDRRAFFG
jgi:hypothetical protein